MIQRNFNLVRHENIRFINPQLYGNCPIELILSNHVQAWYAVFGDCRVEIAIALNNKSTGYTGNYVWMHLRNLESTYGYNKVQTFMKNIILGEKVA